MVENQMNLLISAFIVIILGVVLIVPIGDDVEKVKISSVLVNNETLTFSSLTTIISNESQTNTGNSTVGANYTLSFDDLTTITEIRNQSAIVVTADCNATLSSGIFVCNATNSTNLFFDYTYISGRTDTLANDEIIIINTLKNITSKDITSDCNVTLSTGNIICNNIHSSTGFANYSYIPDTFVRSSTARTLITLVILFFAIAILTVGLGFVMKSFKDAGVL